MRPALVSFLLAGASMGLAMYVVDPGFAWLAGWLAGSVSGAVLYGQPESREPSP